MDPSSADGQTPEMGLPAGIPVSWTSPARHLNTICPAWSLVKQQQLHHDKLPFVFPFVMQENLINQPAGNSCTSQLGASRTKTLNLQRMNIYITCHTLQDICAQSGSQTFPSHGSTLSAAAWRGEDKHCAHSAGAYSWIEMMTRVSWAVVRRDVLGQWLTKDVRCHSMSNNALIFPLTATGKLHKRLALNVWHRSSHILQNPNTVQPYSNAIISSIGTIWWIYCLTAIGYDLAHLTSIAWWPP